MSTEFFYQVYIFLFARFSCIVLKTTGLALQLQNKASPRQMLF